MFEWIKSLFSGPTPEEWLEGLQAYEMMNGRPFFRGKSCPFSQHVREKGVASRKFASTRHDN